MAFNINDNEQEELIRLFTLLKDTEWLISQFTYEVRYSVDGSTLITSANSGNISKMDVLINISRNIQTELFDKLKDKV